MAGSCVSSYRHWFSPLNWFWNSQMAVPPFSLAGTSWMAVHRSHVSPLPPLDLHAAAESRSMSCAVLSRARHSLVPLATISNSPLMGMLTLQNLVTPPPAIYGPSPLPSLKIPPQLFASAGRALAAGWDARTAATFAAAGIAN